MKMRRGGGGAEVEVIGSRGCTKLFVGNSTPSSVHSVRRRSLEDPMSSPASLASDKLGCSTGPFSGLVICVTGLSKEARKQVMEATEKLGGQYSPNLHPECSHLVVQSFGGRKLEHALKHGSRNGLFVVTLGWFVDSVRRNVRLSESLYSVKIVGENGTPTNDVSRLVGHAVPQNTCLPAGILEHTKQCGMVEESPTRYPGREAKISLDSTLSNQSLYIDSELSHEMRSTILEAASRAGATFLDRWFVGCHASHVVCEGPSIQRYLGHCGNIVSPFWVLKTAKEKNLQKLCHMSVDLARQVGTMLENCPKGILQEKLSEKIVDQDDHYSMHTPSYEERQQTVYLAKTGVRNRRSRRMQTCQTPIRPITPSSLLDSICWTISEPTSSASIYTESFTGEYDGEPQANVSLQARMDDKDSETSFVNFSRPLKESEKSELIFKNHFLTILFPIDRFSELGPSSRTFFSDKGFTCLQVLNHIYSFYQENMSTDEIEVAIHSDSRHADRLRSIYASEETAKRGLLMFKRIDFLGSRKSFEMLKRVSGDNSSNVYELLIRA